MQERELHSLRSDCNKISKLVNDWSIFQSSYKWNFCENIFFIWRNFN